MIFHFTQEQIDKLRERYEDPRLMFVMRNEALSLIKSVQLLFDEVEKLREYRKLLTNKTVAQLDANGALLTITVYEDDEVTVYKQFGMAEWDSRIEQVKKDLVGDADMKHAEVVSENWAIEYLEGRSQ